MIGYIQTEHLFFKFQLLSFVELQIRNRLLLGKHFGFLTQVTEQTHHSLVALSPTHHGVIDNCFEYLQQPLARVAEFVERASLNE